MVHFHELFPTFHHVLHSTFSIGFTSLCLLVQTLHRCFLNEPSVLLSFLQGLNYTIEREKKISFTHSQQRRLSLPFSLSQCFSHFFCTNSFHETQTYSCWATQSPSLSCGLMGKNRYDWDWIISLWPIVGTYCHYYWNLPSWSAEWSDTQRRTSSPEFLLLLLLLLLRCLCVLKAAPALWAGLWAPQRPLCPRPFALVM